MTECPTCHRQYTRLRHHAMNPMGICEPCRRHVRRKRFVMHRRMVRIARDLRMLRHSGTCLGCELSEGHLNDCEVWLMLECINEIKETLP